MTEHKHVALFLGPSRTGKTTAAMKYVRTILPHVTRVLLLALPADVRSWTEVLGAEVVVADRVPEPSELACGTLVIVDDRPEYAREVEQLAMHLRHAHSFLVLITHHKGGITPALRHSVDVTFTFGGGGYGYETVDGFPDSLQ